MKASLYSLLPLQVLKRPLSNVKLRRRNLQKVGLFFSCLPAKPIQFIHVDDSQAARKINKVQKIAFKQKGRALQAFLKLLLSLGFAVEIEL